MAAVVGVGPSVELQHGDAPSKAILFFTATWIILLPKFALSVSRDGFPKLTRKEALTFFGASISYTVTSAGFAISLDYTSVGNAVIFSNTHALLMLLGHLLLG